MAVFHVRQDFADEWKDHFPILTTKDTKYHEGQPLGFECPEELLRCCRRLLLLLIAQRIATQCHHLLHDFLCHATVNGPTQ